MKKFILYVFAVTLIQSVIIGNLLTYGAYFPIFINELKTSFIDAIMAGSIQFMFLFIGALIIIPLSEQYELRGISSVGALLWFGGMYGLSTSIQPQEPILFIGFINGLGGSIVYWASLTQMYKWSLEYNMNPVTPLGISFVGSSIGQLVYVLKVPLHVSSSQWRDTFKNISYIGLSLLLVSILFLFKNPTQKRRHKYEVCEISKERNGAMFFISSAILMFGLYAPFIIIVMDAQQLNASYLDATYLLVYLSGSSIIGRIISFELTKSFGILNTHRLFLILTLFTTIGWTGSSTYVLLVMFACFYGFFASSLLTTMMLMCTELWNEDDYSVGLLALSLFLIPGAVSSASITAQLIQNNNGSMIESKVFVILMILISIVPAFAIKKKKELPPDLSGTELS
jgi:MFS family permease